MRDRQAGRETAPGRSARQLALGLPTRIPALPRGLRPMRARRQPAPPADAGLLLDAVWGGRRVLVGCEAAGPWLIDARGHEVDLPAGPLAAALSVLAPRSCLLDGELLTGEEPILVAWDLLYLDGRPLLAVPASARRRALLELGREAGPLVCLPGLSGTATAVWRLLAEQRLPGLLCRWPDSPYLPGVRSGLWRIVPTDAATVDPGGPQSQATDATVESPLARRSPILAVIERLPLELPD